MEITALAEIGQKLIRVLKQAMNEPFTTKSDFARYEADYIAQAAEEGLITCKDAEGFYSNVWRITMSGMVFLFVDRNDKEQISNCIGVLETLRLKGYA